MKQEIEALLDELRPALNYDGGDIELIKIDTKNKTIHIRFTGNCSHCAISEVTLKHLVEKEIKKRFPKIKQVIPV